MLKLTCGISVLVLVGVLPNVAGAVSPPLAGADGGSGPILLCGMGLLGLWVAGHPRRLHGTS